MCINQRVRGDHLQLILHAALGKLEDDIPFPKYLRVNQQTIMIDDEN